MLVSFFCFFKQKTAYEMRISDWSSDVCSSDLRAGGFFWAARSYMACGNAPKVEGLMRSAARLEETFYGLLARETLGMQAQMNVLTPRFDSSDWSQLKQYPNVDRKSTRLNSSH